MAHTLLALGFGGCSTVNTRGEKLPLVMPQRCVLKAPLLRQWELIFIEYLTGLSVSYVLSNLILSTTLQGCPYSCLTDEVAGLKKLSNLSNCWSWQLYSGAFSGGCVLFARLRREAWLGLALATVTTPRCVACAFSGLMDGVW